MHEMRRKSWKNIVRNVLCTPRPMCYNRPEVIFMTLDRPHARQAFAEYTSHYNAADPKVKLKIDHTYRVAALCERIANSLSLPPQDVDLAWLCGLLHDVGRFEQLRRYGTFIDAKSIDHALMSVTVLFEEGRLRDYIAGTDEDALLRTAIRLHNAYRLPEEMDDRTQMFCQILRDADKIDILRVNVETPMEQIYNVSTEALRQSPVSPAVLDAFYEHHCVLRTLNHYPADNAVGHASFVFELCYPESLRAVAEQGWLWKLLDFKTENPDTAKAFAGMKAEMQRWLEEHAK